MSLPIIDEDGNTIYAEPFTYDVDEWKDWAFNYVEAPNRPEYVYCDVSNSRRLGRVVKVNGKTMRVKIMKGAKTSFTIKRHIIKHNVRCYEEDQDNDN